MMILFFPVGLVLLWKYTDYQKKTKAIITVALIALIIFAPKDDNEKAITQNNQPKQNESQQSNLEKPKNTKGESTLHKLLVSDESSKKPQTTEMTQEQKAALFQNWEKEFNITVSEADGAWIKIDEVLKLSGAGKISIFQAYENLNKLSNKLKNIKYPKPPKELPKKDRELLEEAIDKFESSNYTRGNIASKAADLLDKGNNVKPSDFNEIKTLTQISNDYIQEAVTKVTAVRISYGL